MAKSPDEMMNAMMANFEEKTGNNLDHWLNVVNASGEEKHMAIVKYLKTEHGFTHGYAGLIAFKAREATEPTLDSNNFIDNQYKGPKAELKPIYTALCKVVEAFGNDVEVSPRKTYVTIRRSKQFAIFKPSTKDRLDVGLVLKGIPETDRLQTGKQFSGMMTHCVAVHTKEDIDSELKNWLKHAYESA